MSRSCKMEYGVRSGASTGILWCVEGSVIVYYLRASSLANFTNILTCNKLRKSSVNTIVMFYVILSLSL